MSVTTTLTRLRELARALPRPGVDWEERPHFDPPASQETVAEIERAASFELPDELRAFLEQNESIVAMSFHNGYWLGGIKHLMEEGSLPRVANGEAAIPIATDGGGNAFLLTASGGVWRWDHETARVEKVAASFGVFLKRVAEDWAAYLSDERDWRYLA